MQIFRSRTLKTVCTVKRKHPWQIKKVNVLEQGLSYELCRVH